MADNCGVIDERVCRHCDEPYLNKTHKKASCDTCALRRRNDYAALNRFEMTVREYERRWTVIQSKEERADRSLLDGAVPLSGMVFMWRGRPYLAESKKDELKALL